MMLKNEIYNTAKLCVNNLLIKAIKKRNKISDSWLTQKIHLILNYNIIITQNS